MKRELDELREKGLTSNQRDKYKDGEMTNDSHVLTSTFSL